MAMVVSSVGFHWEEVFRAYWELKDSKCDVEIFSVEGAPARPDPLSLASTGPGAWIGIGVPRDITPDTMRGRVLRVALDDVAPLKQLDPDRFDALYLPGGHGCLFDVNRDRGLHAVIAQMYTRGCILGGVCHATSAYAFVKVDGRSIVEGHEMTGFPHALDRALTAVGLVRREFLPLPLVNDDELRRAGARLSSLDEAMAVANPHFMRVSPPFVTGVGPKAAGLVARAMVDILHNRQHRPSESTRPNARPTQGRHAPYAPALFQTARSGRL